MTDSGRPTSADASNVADAGNRRAITIEEAARDAVDLHAAGTTSVEVGGVLAGYVDDETGDVVITAAIPAYRATSAVASLTFTHEAWDDVNEIMSRDHEGLKMVGWYHSHPRFGIFLSEYDIFIQKNFFSETWQIAYVVDPIGGNSGVFGWEDGQIVRLRTWSIIARGAAKPVREPDRGDAQRKRAQGEPPASVRVENEDPPRPSSPGKNRIIVGGIALLLLIGIVVGAVLALTGKAKTPLTKSGAGASHPVAGTPSNPNSAETAYVQSKRLRVRGGTGLFEQWAWSRLPGTSDFGLYTVTISLAAGAREIPTAYGTVKNCGPTLLVSETDPASELPTHPTTASCNITKGPLSPGGKQIFAFFPSFGTDISGLGATQLPVLSEGQAPGAASPVKVLTPSSSTSSGPAPKRPTSRSTTSKKSAEK